MVRLAEGMSSGRAHPTAVATAPTPEQAQAGLPHDDLLGQERFRPNAVDAVVFDIGDVLLHWDPRQAVAAAVGMERAEAFVGDAEFDFFAWNLDLDRGLEWVEAQARAQRRCPHFAREISAYRENFSLAIAEPVTESVVVLTELHQRGIPLFALTNFSADLFAIARAEHDFLGLFEDIVVSGEEGVVKPDPEIFEELEARIRHVGSLEDAVFIDDSPVNVMAAEEAGMDAILFTGPGHLREDLRARGLPLAPG